MDKSELSRLWDIGFSTILELETEQGILASGREEIYGCIFGRDSLITGLNLIKAYKKTGNPYFLTLVKKILGNLVLLQGKEVNIESGEEPGKCIHEWRPSNHEHLTKHESEPWYVYPDNAMRNYDTVDATPLLLIAIHAYHATSGDDEFLKEVLPNVMLALDWLLTYGDSNGDGFIDYRFHPERRYGGLRTQSWMDSSESLFHEDGELTSYPIAPVEVQAYAYVALRAWSSYFENIQPDKARELADRAHRLKTLFNETFVVWKNNEFNLAFALDGTGKPLLSARSSIGHCLWAVWEDATGKKDGILYDEYIPLLARRLLLPDLFEPQAGIRTLSTVSVRFDPHSYHNGSIWPHDTAIIAGGLENFGFHDETALVKRALHLAYEHFQTPIELFVFQDGRYGEYLSKGGQTACRKQAWSASSMLAL